MNKQQPMGAEGQVTPVIWAGIDVAKKSFEAAIHLPELARPIATRGFDMSDVGTGQFLQWCDKIITSHAPGAQLRVVMEATGCYSRQLFEWLTNLRPQTQPAMLNPSFIKSFGQSLGVRNKTDKVDARIIAHYGHERKPAPDMRPTPEMNRLQLLVRERRTICDALTAEKNRAGEPCEDKDVLKLRNQRIALLTKQLKDILALLRKTVKQSQTLSRDIKLLQSIPGVGFIVAVTVLGELGDLRRFLCPRKLSAFAGLSPRYFTSGSSVNRPAHICRMGNKAVRPLLHLAARSLVGRTKYHLGRLYEKLVAAGKTKPAAVTAISRKILVLMRAILISGKPYNDELCACGKAA